MSYTPSRGVNRYWKRPKPRIYECNLRDAERFYKDSYSSYLQSKEFASSYGSKGIEDEFATKWTMNRIGNEVDSSYRDPLRREASMGLGSEYVSPYEDSSQRSSRVAFSRHDSMVDSQAEQRPSNRARSMVQTRYDDEPQEDLREVEQRLERIRKLKEELGITGDVANDSSRPILKKTARRSPSESRTSQHDYAQTSYSSARAGSRQPQSSADDYESKYANRSERNARFSSKYSSSDDQPAKSYKYDDSTSYSASKSSRNDNNDDMSSYSASNYSRKDNSKYGDEDASSYSRSRLSKRDAGNYGNEDDSSSYKYSSASRKAAARSTTNGDAEEDDELVSNLRKKFPTSEEILERIKKMDADL